MKMLDLIDTEHNNKIAFIKCNSAEGSLFLFPQGAFNSN